MCTGTNPQGRSPYSARHLLAADSAVMPECSCEQQLFFRIFEDLKERDWVTFSRRYNQAAQEAQNWVHRHFVQRLPVPPVESVIRLTDARCLIQFWKNWTRTQAAVRVQQLNDCCQQSAARNQALRNIAPGILPGDTGAASGVAPPLAAGLQSVQLQEMQQPQHHQQSAMGQQQLPASSRFFGTTARCCPPNLCSNWHWRQAAAPTTTIATTAATNCIHCCCSPNSNY